MMQEIKNLFRHRYLIIELVKKDLKSKYIGSKIGMFWSVFFPLARLLTFIFVFSAILKVRFDDKEGITNFALYMICGMLPWFFFQQAIVRSETVLLENANMVKYIIFPTKIFPFYVTISSLIDMIIGFIFFTLAVGFVMHTINIFTIPFVLIIIVLQFVFTMGFSWIFATLNILIRDTFHIVDLSLMIWMYLTPIFYPENMIPMWAKSIVTINPMAYFVRYYREIYFKNRFPDVSEIMIFFAISLALFFIGYYMFKKNQGKFADLI